MFMKKLIFTLVVALSSVFALSAQEVGQWWVGGSVGAWSTKVKGSDAVWSAKINPEIGYAFSENLAFGVQLGYAHSERGLEALGLDNLVFNELALNTNAYSISPFLRMSFLKGDLGALFVDGGVGYTYAKVSGLDDALNVFEVGFKPGVAFNVSDNIALLGKFGFAGYQYAKLGDLNENSFGLKLDMSQFQVGAIVKF